MICRKCGISYDNVKSYCPNCRAVVHLSSEQKEKLRQYITGNYCVEVYEVCEQCGREVLGKRIRLSDENARLLGFSDWFLPDDHDCSQENDRFVI
jgi:hypothetical protein